MPRGLLRSPHGSHSIEVELNFPTRVNAYVTPAESTGFVPHYDPHDVLILRIQGSKIWRLSDSADVPPHEMLRREGARQIRPPLVYESPMFNHIVPSSRSTRQTSSNNSASASMKA